ncbi:hypothetical protein D9M68_554410 [compost metagenome]
MAPVSGADVHGKGQGAIGIQQCHIRFVIEPAQLDLALLIGGGAAVGRHHAGKYTVVAAAGRSDKISATASVIDVEAPDLSTHVANEHLVCQLVRVADQRAG